MNLKLTLNQYSNVNLMPPIHTGWRIRVENVLKWVFLLPSRVILSCQILRGNASHFLSWPLCQSETRPGSCQESHATALWECLAEVVKCVTCQTVVCRVTVISPDMREVTSQNLAHQDWHKEWDYSYVKHHFHYLNSHWLNFFNICFNINNFYFIYIPSLGARPGKF